MESQNKKHSFKLISVVIVLGLIISTPFEIIAQQSGEKEHLPHVQKNLDQLFGQHQTEEQQQSPGQLGPVKSGIDLQTLNAEYTVLEQDQDWIRSPNPNPEHNFELFHQGQPAGNINGDSSGTENPVDDYVVTGLARDEQTTSVLGDQVWKTAVFYGDNTSGTPDEIIRRKLVPVGDLNGDGYADAVAAKTSSSGMNEPHIYKGTASGYVNTFETADEGFDSQHQQIAFNDFNRDGYDDILFYSPSGEDIIITWGAELFSDISTSFFTGKLTQNIKRIAVADVDKDNAQEIVELSGEAGSDGQLQILEVDIMADTLFDAVTVEESFFFSDFSGTADNNDLHLLDINGNGFHEIYISEGRTAPKRVVEYDSLSAGYNPTSTEIFTGTLVPAGDLNNDGRHDFIMGDADNSELPWIAYGPANLGTPLSLDVELNSNGGATWWSWNMQYNPYGSFGDLNGDGMDDVVMEHSEESSGSNFVGRRILSGSESESDISDFHQYPYENFYSIIDETEEVGDVNGDGIPDFAVSHYTASQIEVYFGGSSIGQTPDQILDLGYTPEGISGGDFNGDGISDITVSGAGGQQFAIFFGGGSIGGAADYALNINDFLSPGEISFYSNVENVGDVNADGIDDFLLRTETYSSSEESDLNTGFLFFGGSSISPTPDITIGLNSSSTRDENRETTSALGDINGDGVDDFAVGVSVAHSDGSSGQVQVYLGGEDKTFTSADIILKPEKKVEGFGSSITGGDFNGDNINDIAVSSSNSLELDGNPTAVHLYKGGEEGLDIENIHFLTMPQIFIGEDTVGEDGYLSVISGTLETIPDFTGDNRDELLLTSAYTHAVLYLTNDNQSEPAIVLEAPNQSIGLGGVLNVASGDFDNDGQLDLILTQPLDNNDAYFSSRFYRYGLPVPIEITSVEDVPDDQGGKVHLHLGGVFLDAIFQENIYGFDKFEVQYLDDNGGWVPKEMFSAPTPDRAKYLEVDGLTTQPSNTEEVDNSYLFRVVLLEDGEGSPVVLSDTVRGAAFDNLSPVPVQNLNIVDEGGDKMLSWSAPGDNDVGEYLIYEADASGEQSGVIFGKSTGNEFPLSGNFEGVQNFGVKARDVNNNLGAVSMPATAVYPQTVDYNMREGWNLIGVPVDTDAQTIQSALQAAENSSIYEYDGGYTEVDMLEAGKGYWAKFSMEDLYQLEGLPFTELTVDLKKGWNLVSGVAEEHAVAAAQDPDEIMLEETVYAFDQAYAPSDTLQPGKGYWIRASASGTVTFIHPKLEANQVEVSNSQKTLAKDVKKIEDKFGMLTISDGEHSRTLFFGAELPDHLNKLQYSLPPLPPGDIFDARFTENTRLTEESEANIKISRIEGTTLKLKLDAQNLVEQNRFVVKEYADDKFLSEYKVNSDEAFNLKNSETNSIYLAPVENSISQNQIPEEFKLEQNYPNPFNPTTQIKYSVTEASDVTLEVFNILGRRVGTLINTQQQPGNYEVTFDGSRLASGVYLYRLQAGSNISTKKFILAK